MPTFKELKQKVQGNNPPEIKPEPKPKIKAQPIENISTFEPEESRYLINLIARSDFKGTDVQIVYNIVVKLQDIIKESLKDTDGSIPR